MLSSASFLFNTETCQSSNRSTSTRRRWASTRRLSLGSRLRCIRCTPTKIDPLSDFHYRSKGCKVFVATGTTNRGAQVVVVQRLLWHDQLGAHNWHDQWRKQARLTERQAERTNKGNEESTMETKERQTSRKTSCCTIAFKRPAH